MSLFKALEHEAALRWEANVRTGQWIAGFSGGAALLCMFNDVMLGFTTSLIAFAALLWFTAVRRARGARVRGVLQAITPGLTLTIPALVMVVVAHSADVETAFAMWIPPLITFCVIALSTARLEPLRPVLYSVVAAALYVVTYWFLTRGLSAGRIANNSSLDPFEQLQRVIFLLGSGVAMSMVTRGLRAAIARAEQRTRQHDLFGKYRLGKPIASGGMATVVEATYCPEGGFERPVAVKRIHPHLATRPELVDSFRAEAELGARLAHPNIVAVLDFGRVDDTYFLAMEHIDGIDLRGLMKRLRRRRTRLPARLAGFIAHEMLQGLAFAHAGARDRNGELLRVVHRDLSPGNVMVARTGDVKITDFGIACTLKEAARHHTGRLIGSFSYLAPEQASQQAFDHRADLFAVGTLLHEMLSMGRLFKRDTTAKTLLAVLHDEPPSVASRHASESWDIFLDRALAKDPNARFSSARAMADALAALMIEECEVMPQADDLAAFLRAARALDNEPELTVVVARDPLEATVVTVRERSAPTLVSPRLVSTEIAPRRTAKAR